ncbi:type I-E CRISPR-associated protein Cas6/Cse3/CasE [Carboxydochorda subterranea]|uniref:Type I-E CRISPR-associated protein Cas6/Cse3/CasE n=1 Tax=Carboxydichorda subterranea TaxID=3109565 RepID=A0ABZ1BUK3_9FIRM|nr:type I-E CRISPR-associated protein Cas6/Cse3/CasE [Limnochorda sp. L945t]WRP16341.1 type I-E CRISPR-associated protein Cas6/Cse3/CasE [Limnochorda sp. L945t]
MYLSKLCLNPRHPLARRDISNPYEMHSTLSWVFEECEVRRFLWRLERGRDPTRPTLLLQSIALPPWDRLQARDGYSGYLREEPQTKRFVLPERVQAGQVFRFRLQANATVTRGGKRYGLRSERDQIAWLERQGEHHGFRLLYYEAGAGTRIPSCQVTSAERRAFRKRRQDPPIVLWSVTYDGYLQVTDPRGLQQALVNGLGHGKALGLGLLSIAPA